MKNISIILILILILILICFVSLKAKCQYSDIEFDLFASYSIIGLGEESHGIKTINEQRNNISFELIKKYDVKFIVWEESFADLYKVNQLLETKNPDFEQILKYFTWFWQTDETLTLLKFIHKHNLENIDKPIILLGIDLSPHISLYNNVMKFFKGKIDDTETLKEYTKFESKFRSYKRLKKKENNRLIKIANSLLNEIETNESKYSNFFSHIEVELMKLNISNIIKTAAYYKKKSDSRDLTMFKNINTIFSLCKPDEKLIIYAHNGHLSKKDDYDFQKTTGYYLNESYKNKYYALGFEFGEGQYLCSYSSIGIVRSLFRAYILKKSLRKFMSSKVQNIPLNQNSEIISYLDSLNKQSIFIDISSLNNQEKMYKLLNTIQLFHNIGGGCTKPEKAYIGRKWSERFDGIFFIKKVQATNAEF